MKKQQSGFLQELATVRGEAKPVKSRFDWSRNLARPQNDSAQPPAKLSDAPKKKPLKTPAPAGDLPRTVNGQLDNAELKQNLANQIRAGRKQQAKSR